MMTFATLRTFFVGIDQNRLAVSVVGRLAITKRADCLLNIPPSMHDFCYVLLFSSVRHYFSLMCIVCTFCEARHQSLCKTKNTLALFEPRCIVPLSQRFRNPNSDFNCPYILHGRLFKQFYNLQLIPAEQKTITKIQREKY